MTPQTALDTSTQQTYLDAYRGRFTSLMRWPQLDEFWDVLRGQSDDGCCTRNTKKTTAASFTLTAIPNRATSRFSIRITWA
jgi:hypothetical protein